MNIKATLARLGNSLGNHRLSQDLLLLSGQDLSLDRSSLEAPDYSNHSDDLNILVGYNGSRNSQMALELTLLIAYQTRLATRKRVIVQAVYVIEGIHPTQKATFAGVGRSLPNFSSPVSLRMEGATATATPTLVQSRRHTVNCVDARAAQIQCFDEADQVLWKARSFASDWRGSLNTHLRFGSPAAELKNVAEQEQVHMMILGCSSTDHPIIQQLQDDCICPVVGIPVSEELDWSRN